jgi:hypothetical protein
MSSACLHFSPAGPTVTLQPSDRAVPGSVEAECQAIHRDELAQNEDQPMTKADFAARLLQACKSVSEEAIQLGWEC